MKLYEWCAIQEPAWTSVRVAEVLGVSQPAAWRYMHHKAIPTKDRMNLIYSMTTGAVSANDYYDHLPVKGI